MSTLKKAELILCSARKTFYLLFSATRVGLVSIKCLFIFITRAKIQIQVCNGKEYEGHFPEEVFFGKICFFCCLRILCENAVPHACSPMNLIFKKGR